MKRDDYFISIGVEPSCGSYELVDDMGRYSDTGVVPMQRAVFPISLSSPSVCMGIGCHLHQCCEKYHAVDGSDPDAPRMATCLDTSGFSGFSVK